MSDISPLARSAYRHGIDPIDYAITIAKCQIEARDEVFAARLDDPNAFPVYSLDDKPETIARVIVGKLLDAGWKPPQPDGEA